MFTGAAGGGACTLPSAPKPPTLDPPALVAVTTTSTVSPRPRTAAYSRPPSRPRCSSNCRRRAILPLIPIRRRAIGPRPLRRGQRIALLRRPTDRRRGRVHRSRRRRRLDATRPRRAGLGGAAGLVAVTTTSTVLPTSEDCRTYVDAVAPEMFEQLLDEEQSCH